MFLPPSEHWLLIKTNWQVIRLKSPGKKWLSFCNKFYLSPLVCTNPKPPSFIIGNTDIDFLSSDLPISPPIAPLLNLGLASVGTEMVVPCEITLSLFAIKSTLTFINSNLSWSGWRSHAGSCWFFATPFSYLDWFMLAPNIYIQFWWPCIDPSSSNMTMSLPISSALNAEVMPSSQYSYKYSSGLLKCDRPYRLLNKPSSWHYTQNFSSKCEHSP